ncbi:hypothetical protein D1159_15775 [Pseudoflavonifractor sp. 524-17]|nr:transposase [Pseudoflavonifractor sp. 524-17]NCE65998.1 hypothetical protein [Pseudoflavonifractor sp. 524-17]
MSPDASETQKRLNGTPEYYEVLRLRQIWCVGNFSHQKANHNLQRTRKRGLGKAAEHCLLSATAFNLKRMVKLLRGLPPRILYSLLPPSRRLIFRRLLLFLQLCQQRQSGQHPRGNRGCRPGQRYGHHVPTLRHCRHGGRLPSGHRPV